MHSSYLARTALTLAVSFALAGSLTACGGGGGGANVRPSSPPTTPPPSTPPPANPPPVTPPPTTPPVTSTYTYPQDNLLVATHVADAQAEGFTGKGVKVAILDSGITPSMDTFAKLNYTFQSFNPGVSGTPAANDTDGHGSVMAAIAFGGKTSTFNGGVAPDAQAYIGQICYGSPSTCYASKEAVDSFYSAGVRIFNFSLGNPSTNGGVGEDGNFGANNYFTYAYQTPINNGALMIWAAGNGGANTTNIEAVAPYYLPGLQQGWLSVVNVDLDSTTGKVTGLYTGNSTPSAACNIAAAWCLAAPGYNYTPAVPNSQFTSGLSVGTSDSTAIVTGVAALVSQAYPWMTGHNLQQTILTTATHLADVSTNGTTTVSQDYSPGTVYVPNATYGWGLVDAERAVHGPGQFTDNFDANIGSNVSAFDNVISGAGSLSLEGNSDGVLTLSAANTYTGGTTIKSGTLNLSGSVGSDVTLSGGVLVGAGKVNGNVANTAGTVVSNSATSGAGLTITGNYTAGASSTTGIALDHALNVGGTASLAGKLALTAPTTYAPKSIETLINAGTVTGTFGSVDGTGLPFYTTALTYGQTTVTAAVTRSAVPQSTSMSTPVMVTAAQGVENALKQADTWSQTDYAGHKEFLDTAAQLLAAPSRQMADASVASLSGEIHGTVGAIEATTSAQVDHAVSLRQNGTLQGDAVSAWVQGFTGNAGLSQSGYASARTLGNGTLVGLDIPVTSSLTGGVFFGRNRSNSTLDALAGRVNERDTLGGIYANYRFEDGTYLAGRASWTHADMDVQRTALLGNSLESLSTRRTDGVGRLTLEAGKSFGSFTPYVSLTSLRLDQAGFSEKGAGGFGITAAGHRQSATMGDLGGRWSYAFQWIGGESRLTGYAAYERVFAGSDVGYDASLVGAPNAVFQVNGQFLPRNTYTAGATLDTSINATWSWFIDADWQVAPNRFHSFTGNAGLRFTF